MFSDERAVTYPAEGSHEKSVFVPADDVQGEPGSRGKVRVIVVSQGGQIMAVLPSSSRDIVFVSKNDISE